MKRVVKNAVAVIASACFIIGMQGFAIGGFSGQATSEAAKIAHLGVDPVTNVVWLAAGWGLLCLARSLGRRET
ncbi:MAG TPA: hypothetical protein VFD47_07175 [Actinomycetota bacterium]|nr:hypothetical protein [Actinomycetota bacterium]